MGSQCLLKSYEGKRAVESLGYLGQSGECCEFLEKSGFLMLSKDCGCRCECVGLVIYAVHPMMVQIG